MSKVLAYVCRPRPREPIPDIDAQTELVRERAGELGLTLDDVLIESAGARRQPLFLRPVGHRLAALPTGSQIIAPSPSMVSPDPMDAENVIRAWGIHRIILHVLHDGAWQIVDCNDGEQVLRMLEVLQSTWSTRAAHARDRAVRSAEVMEFVDALIRMSWNDRPR